MKLRFEKHECGHNTPHGYFYLGGNPVPISGTIVSRRMGRRVMATQEKGVEIDREEIKRAMWDAGLPDTHPEEEEIFNTSVFR